MNEINLFLESIETSPAVKYIKVKANIERFIKFRSYRLFMINSWYSVLWIWFNHSDKYEYRDNSKIHHWLVDHY